MCCLHQSDYAGYDLQAGKLSHHHQQIYSKSILIINYLDNIIVVSVDCNIIIGGNADITEN